MRFFEIIFWAAFMCSFSNHCSGSDRFELENLKTILQLGRAWVNHGPSSQEKSDVYEHGSLVSNQKSCEACHFNTTAFGEPISISPLDMNTQILAPGGLKRVGTFGKPTYDPSKLVPREGLLWMTRNGIQSGSDGLSNRLCMFNTITSKKIQAAERCRRTTPSRLIPGTTHLLPFTTQRRASRSLLNPSQRSHLVSSRKKNHPRNTGSTHNVNSNSEQVRKNRIDYQLTSELQASVVSLMSESLPPAIGEPVKLLSSTKNFCKNRPLSDNEPKFGENSQQSLEQPSDEHWRVGASEKMTDVISSFVKFLQTKGNTCVEKNGPYSLVDKELEADSFSQNQEPESIEDKELAVVCGPGSNSTLNQAPGHPKKFFVVGTSSQRDACFAVMPQQKQISIQAFIEFERLSRKFKIVAARELPDVCEAISDVLLDDPSSTVVPLKFIWKVIKNYLVSKLVEHVKNFDFCAIKPVIEGYLSKKSNEKHQKYDGNLFLFYLSLAQLPEESEQDLVNIESAISHLTELVNQKSVYPDPITLKIAEELIKQHELNSPEDMSPRVVFETIEGIRMREFGAEESAKYSPSIMIVLSYYPDEYKKQVLRQYFSGLSPLKRLEMMANALANHDETFSDVYETIQDPSLN